MTNVDGGKSCLQQNAHREPQFSRRHTSPSLLPLPPQDVRTSIKKKDQLMVENFSHCNFETFLLLADKGWISAFRRLWVGRLYRKKKLLLKISMGFVPPSTKVYQTNWLNSWWKKSPSGNGETNFDIFLLNWIPPWELLYFFSFRILSKLNLRSWFKNSHSTFCNILKIYKKILWNCNTVL